MLNIMLRIKVQSGRRKDFLDTARSIIGPTSVLPGCISCRLSQDLNDPDIAYLIEEWETREDLDTRIRSEEFRVILSLMELSDESPEIKFFTVSKCEGMEVIERLRMPAMH